MFLLCKCTILGTRNTKIGVHILFLEQNFVGFVPECLTKKCNKSTMKILFEPPHDKTNKMSVRPAKTQISLGIRSVWSESSLSLNE